MRLGCNRISPMKDIETIISELNREGFRSTRIRKSMLEVILALTGPASAFEIMSSLLEKKVSFNKATIYRELAFLKERRLIQEVRIPHEKGMRFEAAQMAHHHHLICVSCKKIEDIVLQKELEEQENEIYRSTGFQVLGHTLEFMGLCQGCR